MIYGLVGHNGSGKTEIFKMIKDKMTKGRVVHCEQKVILYEELTAIQHVAICNNLKNSREDQDELVLNACKVPLGIKVADMNKESRKRLQIALSLNTWSASGHSDIVLLDNPCSHF